MKKVLAFFIPFFILSLVGYAQSIAPTVVASQGGYAQGVDISLQWTLGEGFVETTYYKSVVFTEGFNQPTIDFSNPNSKNENSDYPTSSKGNAIFGNLSFETFPNPFQTYLNVSIIGSFKEDVEVRLVDLNGMVLKSVKISPESPTNKLDVEELPAALYMIHVINESTGQVAVFRVFKFK